MPVLNGAVRTAQGFPPTVKMLQKGIQGYRNARGFEPRGNFPFKTMKNLLVGKEFSCGAKSFRIRDVRFHEIAGPIYSVGDVEGMFELTVPGIAAAIGAYPFLGTGDKDGGDGAATQAMRAAMKRISMRGTIKGGEGGGRDEMGREAALFLDEPVGSGYGYEVDFLVDPLEVTNQAKPLNLEKGDFKGGEGWHPDLIDPLKWYAGYSGALSLLAATNASGPRGGFRRLTDDLYLNKFFLAWQLENRGLNLNSSAGAVIQAAAETFGVTPQELRAAGLGRSRHKTTFQSWIEEGMLDENIIKPTDGDSMFAWPIASDLLHFAGLTGGVMEGVIGGMAGVPVGNSMTFQFVSHARLKEEKASADLLAEEHKFGFSQAEYDTMIRSELYDSAHIGSTLRRLSPTSSLRAHIIDAAHNEVDTPGFDHKGFLNEFAVVGNLDPKIRGGSRFSNPSRDFLTKILERKGWWDVRRVGRLPDFRFSRDNMYFVTALTPNKWAPLEGIKAGNGKITTESLFAGGSQTVFIMETDSVEV